MLIDSTAPLRRLILFHGLASSPQEFGLLLHPLRRLGIQLECLSVPGYTHGTLNTEAGWGDWVDAAVGVVEQSMASDPAPFLMGGLCTGAMLALAVAARLPRAPLRGLTLFSPLVAYNGWGLPWWYRLRLIAYGLGISRRFSMSEREPYGLKNARMRQWVRSQMGAETATLVGPASVPLNVVRESERLSRHATGLVREQLRPTLVVHAREDEICRLSSVRKIFPVDAGGPLSLEVLDNSYHMITADNDRQRLAELVADFATKLRLDSGSPAPAHSSLHPRPAVAQA